MGELCERHFVLTQDGLARGHRRQMTPRRGFIPAVLTAAPWHLAMDSKTQGHHAARRNGGKNKVVIAIKDKSRGAKITLSATLIPSLA